jgi:hypothetical protein
MSKFDKIFEAREADTVEVEKSDGQESSVKKKPAAASGNLATAKQKPVTTAVLPAQTNSQTSNKRGRPPAKRSDPNFVGLTTYVRKDTHTRAKIALLQEGMGRELSELVEDLISDWLTTK